MAAIDRALEALDQPAARQRVLRWAAQKFQVETSASGPMQGTIGAPFVEQQSDAVLTDSVDNTAAAEQVRGQRSRSMSSFASSPRTFSGSRSNVTARRIDASQISSS